MFLHIARSQHWSLFGRRIYELTASLEATPDQVKAIYAHRLDRLECFHDRYRDTLIKAAETAVEKARAVGWFTPTLGEAGTIWLETARSLALTYRATRAFKISVGDLIQPGGVTITHRSLSEIVAVERAITDSVAPIIATVLAAISFEMATEIVISPKPRDGETPASDWPKVWRP